MSQCEIPLFIPRALIKDVYNANDQISQNTSSLMGGIYQSRSLRRERFRSKLCS